MRLITFCSAAGRYKYEIEADDDDNVASLKLKLQEKAHVIPQCVQLSVDRTLLENNGLIPSDVTEVSFKEGPDVQDIFLKVKPNVYGIPKIMQVSRTASFANLKKTIADLSKSFEKYHLFDVEGKILEDDRTLEEARFCDDSIIKIWRGDNLLVSFTICNPLVKITDQTRNAGVIEISVSENVENLKCLIKQKLGQSNMNLALFSDGSYLESQQQIVDYPVVNDCTIYYIDLRNKKHISVDKKIESRSKSFSGRFHLLCGDEEEIHIHGYDIQTNSQEILKKLKYEIITHLKVCKSDRFVPLVAMFEDNRKFFIATEKMTDSLKNKLSKLEIKNIVRYSIEILEGLEFMHKHFMLHRNLKCASVLLDQQDHVKLCSFQFSKFLPDVTPGDLETGLLGSRIDDDIFWVAPEVIRSERYGFKADIYSMGATIMEMLTGQHPFYPLLEMHVIQNIMDGQTIPYKETRPSELNQIISNCIRMSQEDRWTLCDLKNQLRMIA